MKYTKEYIVNSYESDVNLDLKINSLFQWFSEIAWEHAKSLGVGFEELEKIERFWVLTGFRLHVNKLPKWQDKVRLETWPSGISGLHYTREFKFYSSNNECLAVASSIWVIFDKILAKPVMPKEFYSLTNISNEKAIDAVFSKIRPRKDLILAFNETAKHTDIDMNKHVNNAVYIRWIENCLGDIYPARIKTLKIQYIHEVKVNEEIQIFSDVSNNVHHWEAKINGDKICFRAEVELVPC